MKNLKKQLLEGGVIEFNTNEDVINVWFSKVTQRFCIEFNAKVIESLKTFSVFEIKLNKLIS